MYIIIAGGGIVGKSITKALVKNHDVVVIDNDFANCEKITSGYGAVAVQGDATNINTLREAGVEKCDYALGVMGRDSENLLFALLFLFNFYVDCRCEPSCSLQACRGASSRYPQKIECRFCGTCPALNYDRNTQECDCAI